MVMPTDVGDRYCVACGNKFRQIIGCVIEMGEDTYPLCRTCEAKGVDRFDYPPSYDVHFE